MPLGILIIADQYNHETLFSGAINFQDYENSLFVVGNVVVHHNHDMVIRDTVSMQQLIGMANVCLD